LSKKKFITEVFKSKGTIGAWSPSSSFLANKMLDPIHFDKAHCIVEYGPGTGVFTHKLLEKMNSNATLLVFEINPAFYEDLKKINDNRLIIINDSAEKLDFYLKENRFTKADYIISSLPFAVIPDKVVDGILNNSERFLSDKGKYIQYQYSLNALSKLKSIFKKVETKFTFLNLPPAFIFICSK
jgi:phospholipid N-methyltransferase